jgi:hypothetical protein
VNLLVELHVLTLHHVHRLDRAYVTLRITPS